MCAPNKIKKGNKAFSYQLRTHLSITISAMVSGHLGAMSRMEVFLHQAWIACQWVALLSYHLNKMLISTKDIADHNFVFH